MISAISVKEITSDYNEAWCILYSMSMREIQAENTPVLMQALSGEIFEVRVSKYGTLEWGAVGCASLNATPYLSDIISMLLK